MTRQARIMTPQESESIRLELIADRVRRYREAIETVATLVKLNVSAEAIAAVGKIIASEREEIERLGGTV